MSLSFLLNIHDKGIEKNPGSPTVFTNFNYENEMERTLFLELKNQNKLMVKISSHNSFLKNCHDKQLVPNGLTTNRQVSASQPNEELLNKINAVSQKNSLEAIDVISRHYDNQIPIINEKITESKDKLKKCCNSEERFQYLLQCLQEFKKKDSKRFGRVKSKKIKRLSDHRVETCFSNTEPNPVWINHLNLRNTEKEFLTSGKELRDRLVDAGMSLLQKQCPYFSFQSSCLSSDHLMFNPAPTIHIHHTGRNHFVTSTSIGGPVRIFDSLNQEPTNELIRQITAIYSPDKQVIPTTIQTHISST